MNATATRDATLHQTLRCEDPATRNATPHPLGVVLLLRGIGGVFDAYL
jgi:hypothetical protein